MYQQGSSIERLPYYHLPRSRPVSFERPSHLVDNNMRPMNSHQEASNFLCKNLSTYITNNNQNHHQKLRHSTEYLKADTVTYNNVPTPFKRGQDESIRQTGEVRAGSPRTPRILINDQSYPTSTVHKSMLRCRSPQPSVSRSADGDNNLAYNRLITPTLQCTSNASESVCCESSCSSQVARDGSHQDALDNQSRHREQGQLVDQQHSESGKLTSSSEFGSAASKSLAADSSSNVRVSSDSSALANISPSSLISSPHLHAGKSSAVLPDSKRDEYLWDRHIERASIAHQTYRTLPIIMPKPKALHDLASGTYMRYSQDPTWELTQSRPSSVGRDFESKIQMAIRSGVSRSCCYLSLTITPA